MRHARLIYPTTLLVSMALAAPSVARTRLPRTLATVEVMTKETRVNSGFNFLLRLRCVLPERVLPGTRRTCRGHARIVTNKWDSPFGGPVRLSGGSRIYKLGPGKEGMLSFHLLRRAHPFWQRVGSSGLRPKSKSR